MKSRKNYFLYFLVLPTMPMNCQAQFNTVQKLPQVVKSKPVLEVQTDSADFADSGGKSPKEYFALPKHQEIAIEYDIPLFVSVKDSIFI